ncbi:transcriptional regulator [Mycobacterium lentiflavum]|uniref:Transcriptional regulator n=1 Tax=Mycobacterium lentiflavum TaxID=141349 RepID=A0A0E4H175_MYCLN|nr:TetR/AcrR family transcriptional regulator [Mycobacterium lentiflavum]MEE3062660.1 TetR/AcrR family transcriptional regulator [Actinomycetota bacterium]ULP41532.1 TetR/AcrR family transcriptional regulator [Mycobacterium lentiflavum]CQD20175.1 transcriptional regulator [Mycobacterium lentiflavum]
MADQDWLIGRGRHDEAAERIYAAAANLMLRHGYDAFSIDAVAAEVHCSPATVYRHAGSKAAIRDVVLRLQAERILDSVREAIAGLTGPERVVTATTVALQRLRADPLAKTMRSMAALPAEGLTDSPIISRFATEMVGLSTPDPLAAQWLVRTFLALWYWPLKDADAESEMVRRFLGPPYAVDTIDSVPSSSPAT